MRDSDVVAAITEAEAATIRAHVPGSKVIVLPNVHDVPEATPSGFGEREDLLFIGGFAHDPNVDAVFHFTGEIEELLRPHLDARLWVVGSKPPEEIYALQSPQLVVTGYVPDADAYFDRCRVFVAPLRYGAGMKGKVGHALAMGLPVVTTSIGAEGMELRDGRDVLVRDDPASFAAAVVEVYSDQELWETLSRNGRELVRERWGPDAMRSRLGLLLEETRAKTGGTIAARGVSS